MLVPGLENKSLFTMISRDEADYSSIHESLCQCAQKMLDKYKQKQAEQLYSNKLGVKAGAVRILLNELSKVKLSRGSHPLANYVAIVTALKYYREELKGHEHLLSVRGNNYALVEQTRGLMGGDKASDPLLRYHELKNKFLELDSSLEDGQKTLLSLLAEKKSLALKTLEILEVNPGMTGEQIMALNEIALLKPDLCSVVFRHTNSVDVTTALLNLSEAGLLTQSLCTEICKHKTPDRLVIAMEMLNKAGIRTIGLVLLVDNPEKVAKGFAEEHERTR